MAFDACTIYDFENFEIQIKDLKGIAKGYVAWLPKWANEKDEKR